MKVQLIFALALLALVALCAEARHHAAPPCVRAGSCSSKDWEAVQLASPSHLIRVVVPVKIKNLEFLQQYVNKISNPNDKDFAQILTFEQIGAITRNDEAIQAVQTFFDAEKIAYELTPNGDYFIAYMTVATAEKVLSTKFHIFHSKAHKKQIVRSFEYTVPAELAEHVNFFGDVISFPVTLRPTPIVKSFLHGVEVPVATGSVTPSFFNQYYTVNSNTVKNAGTTQSLFESLGQSFSPTDLATFESQYNLPANKVTTVIGPNSPNSCTSDPNNCVEANLDVQYIMAIAQGAPTTFWSVGSTGDIFLNWITAVAAASNVPLVHSISYGSIEKEEAPAELQQFDQEAMKLGARGVTIMVSSGDDGVANFEARSDPSQCGFSPSFPATATNVVAVGATQGPESGNPEIACSSNTGGVITTGGGFSTVFTEPSYQTNAVAGYYNTNVTQPPATQYNKGGRGYPDVALLGYSYEVVIGGQTYAVSGTSCASPAFAGLVSLANDARASAGKNPLGLLNQVLYTLGASNAAVYNDITSGENNCCAGEGNPVCCQYGFYAAKGWDPLTGFGSVHFDKLLTALTALP